MDAWVRSAQPVYVVNSSCSGQPVDTYTKIDIDTKIQGIAGTLSTLAKAVTTISDNLNDTMKLLQTLKDEVFKDKSCVHEIMQDYVNFRDTIMQQPDAGPDPGDEVEEESMVK